MATYRKLRQLFEILRDLGYLGNLPIDAFQFPNFPFVADILFWLFQRYDSTFLLPDDISTQTHRIRFLRSSVEFASLRLCISLDAQMLYAAQTNAAEELLKISSFLAEAHFKAEEEAFEKDESTTSTTPSPTSRLKSNEIRFSQRREESSSKDDYLKQDYGEEVVDLSGSTDVILASRLHELRNAQAVSSQLVEGGAVIYEQIGNYMNTEEEGKRQKVLTFLERLGLNLDCRDEILLIDRKIRQIRVEDQKHLSEIEEALTDLKKDEKKLALQKKKKQSDIERLQKRLRSLQSVRPAFLEEYEKLEKELKEEYSRYILSFRSLDYLEGQLDFYYQEEEEQLEQQERQMLKMQQKLRDEEWKLLRGEQEGGGGWEEEYGTEDEEDAEEEEDFATAVDDDNDKTKMAAAMEDSGKISRGYMNEEMGRSADFEEDEDVFSYSNSIKKISTMIDNFKRQSSSSSYDEDNQKRRSGNKGRENILESGGGREGGGEEFVVQGKKKRTSSKWRSDDEEVHTDEEEDHSDLDSETATVRTRNEGKTTIENNSSKERERVVEVKSVDKFHTLLMGGTEEEEEEDGLSEDEEEEDGLSEDEEDLSLGFLGEKSEEVEETSENGEFSLERFQRR